MKILIVDDDMNVRNMLCDYFTMNGHGVRPVGSGQDALKAVEDEEWDVVLADLLMPGMDGITMTRKIRERDSILPVVMITGVQDLNVVVEAMKQGASDFLTKPFKFSQIEIVLRKVMNERQIKEKNAELLRDLEQKKAIEALNLQLSGRIKEISSLYYISEGLEVVEDINDLSQKIVHLAASVTDAERCVLFLLDQSTGTLTIKGSVGIDPTIVSWISVPMGKGVIGKVAKGGEAIIVEYGQGESDDVNYYPYKTDSLISVPLKIRGEVFGVLCVTDKIGGLGFSYDEVYYLKTLAQKACLKFENYALYESIYSNLMDTFYALVTSLEARDIYTCLHSQRVTQYSMDIGVELHLSKQDLDILRFASYLHDIGKIGIRDDVLLKPGKLTLEEFEIIKSHPVKGEEIVRNIGLLPQERAVIRNHHERIDGKGYPDGLKGNDIPLLPRIVAAADAFDAITSNRIFRRAKPQEVAIQILEENCGTQFDGDVVVALKKAFERVPMYHETVGIDFAVRSYA